MSREQADVALLDIHVLNQSEDPRGAMAEQQVRAMVTQLRSLAASDAGEKAILFDPDSVRVFF